VCLSATPSVHRPLPHSWSLAQVCATIECLYGCTDTFKLLTVANDVTVTSAPVVRNARCDGEAPRPWQRRAAQPPPRVLDPVSRTSGSAAVGSGRVGSGRVSHTWAGGRAGGGHNWPDGWLYRTSYVVCCVRRDASRCVQRRQPSGAHPPLLNRRRRAGRAASSGLQPHANPYPQGYR
jgi:hypothetical protein